MLTTNSFFLTLCRSRYMSVSQPDLQAAFVTSRTEDVCVSLPVKTKQMADLRQPQEQLMLLSSLLSPLYFKIEH